MEKTNVTPMFKFDAETLLMITEYHTSYHMYAARHELVVDSKGMLHVTIEVPVYYPDENVHMPEEKLVPLQEWFDMHMVIDLDDLPF